MKEKKDITETSSLEINAYDFNKMAMDTIKISPKVIKEKCAGAAQDIFNRKKNKSYWMLLCRERYDFTIFEIFSNTSNEFEKALYECLKNRGKIIDIDKIQEDGNYEIWIKDKDTKENFIYYLFDYNNGVIEV